MRAWFAVGVIALLMAGCTDKAETAEEEPEPPAPAATPEWRDTEFEGAATGVATPLVSASPLAFVGYDDPSATLPVPAGAHRAKLVLELDRLTGTGDVLLAFYPPGCREWQCSQQESFTGDRHETSLDAPEAGEWTIVLFLTGTGADRFSYTGTWSVLVRTA